MRARMLITMSNMQVKTTPLEAKNSYFANVKSNNYLQNALAVMDAESEECDQVRSSNATLTVHAATRKPTEKQLLRLNGDL